MKRSYDYIIAGAGSAGCTLAARLAEDPAVSVLLVEAGGTGQSLFTRMPAGNGFLFGNPRFDWSFRSVPQAALNGREIYYPRGKGLGGTSLINGMIYIRGCAADYDRWRQKGLRGWSYADVLPYFRRSAGAAHRPGDPFHATGGPLKIGPAGNFDAINRLFVLACIEAGNPANGDFNGARQEGAGQIDVTVSGGRRQSAAQTYLARRPPNLTIATDTRVLRVILANRRATGLALSGGEVHAAREVILSLGAFGSPQCLMLSGIGPAGHLARHGIAPLVDLPGVGQALTDHPQMPMRFGLSDPRLSMARFQRIDRAVAIGLRYLLARSGPAAAPFWSSVLFHALRNREMPELEIYFTPMCVSEEQATWRFSPASLLNVGNLILARGKAALPGLQFDISLQRPASRGSVRLASADPLAPPRIDPGFLTDPADMADLIAGIRHVRAIVAQPAFRGIVTDEWTPGSRAATDSDLAEAVRAHVGTGHHPVSTCRMGGEHDQGAVLDANLRVRGVAGLRVVDASAFPDQIGGNTNAPVIMLAEKAADMILGRPPLPPDTVGGGAA